MKNIALKNELKELLSNSTNIVVTKGSVSGCSIEIEHKNEPLCYDSLCYNGKVADRDSDFIELTALLEVN